MFAFEDVGQGIRRLSLPLPTPPHHVHCYLLPGDGWTLVDTGLAVPAVAEALAGVDVARIVVTHFHPDHVGGAGPAAAATGAPVFQGEADYALCERVWGSDDWPQRVAAWLRAHGVPEETADGVLAEGEAARPLIRYARDPVLVRPGDELAGWTVVALPGHADGHIGLLRGGVLVAGDHLLAGISPAIGLWPDGDRDPLGGYLGSLRATADLAPRLVLPGHGDPIGDPAGRAQEIADHHRARLDATLAALRPGGQTAYELSLTLFGADLPPGQRRFAVAETLAHVEHLVARGRASRHGDGGTFSYTGRGSVGRHSSE